MSVELTIGQKLSRIQQEFKAKKGRKNSFGNYFFRSAEDILEGLKPLEEKYDVFFKIDEDIDLVGEDVVIKSTAYVVDAKTGKLESARAVVGVDRNQKGMQVPQRYGSASSYAKKYSLGNLLLIDDTQDADATNKGGNTTATSFKDKPWLNKEDDKFAAALAYVVDQKTYDATRGKYNMSKDVNELLLNQIK